MPTARMGWRNCLCPLLESIVFPTGACVVGDVLSHGPPLDRVGMEPGIGRVGSIVGPVTAGWFIAHQWSTRAIFLALAIPAFISMVFVFFLRWTKIEVHGERL